MEKTLRWMGRTLKTFLAPAVVIARRRTHSGRLYILPAAETKTDPRYLVDPVTLPEAKRPELARYGAKRKDEQWRLIEADDFVVMSATNMSSAAHDVVFSPQLGHDSGTLDLIVMRGASRLQLVKTFVAMETGTHVSLPGVEVFRVTQFVLEPRRSSGELNLSGEEYPLAPTFVECRPRAATFWG